MTSETRMPAGASRSSLVLLALLAAVSVALSVFVVTPEVWLDDPFIGYRYATNLVEGHGLVYNPGEAIEGYTAFGWIMLAWVGMLIGTGPLLIIQVVSVAAQVATLGLLYFLGRSSASGRSSHWSLLAPALLAVHVSFVTWPMMGMSTSFIALLVTLIVVLMQRGVMDRRGGSLAMGAVLLVLCLTRFDGLVLSAIVFAWAFLVAREPRKWIPAMLVLAIGLLVYNAWRIGYYGDLLPNTFHAKQSDLRRQLGAGAHYVLRFFSPLQGGPFALLLLLLPLTIGRATRAMGLAAWVAAAHLGYVLVVGGDWMVYWRFVLPVLPLLCFLLQESLWHAHERWRPRPGAASAALGGAVLVALLVLDVVPLLRSRWVREVPSAYWIPTDAVAIGKHLDQALPPDALVATEWAGIIPFNMRQPILDIFGLNDREISSMDFTGSAMGRGITAEYLVQRHPDLVIVVGRIYATYEEAVAGIDARPEGTWIRDFYASLREPPYGFELCVVRIGERGFWPVLVRPGFPGRESLCVKAG